jgi:hypothetical protein
MFNDDENQFQKFKNVINPRNDSQEVITKVSEKEFKYFMTHSVLGKGDFFL